MKRIYLDHAAATPLDERVLAAMMPYLTTQYGNPSSLHYFGQQARAAVQKARGQVASCLHVKPQDIVFTSGGTEADNLAVLGYIRANYPQGGHLITTAVEHHAVLRTFEVLQRRGYTVTILPVDTTGRVRVEDVAEAIRPDTILISVMYANNETGTVQPIKEIGALAQQKGIVFHVDAVQAYGYIPIHPLEDHIDMLTICSHKIYGPKGVGALYIRHGLNVAADAYGGPQEHRLRAGTENVAGIVGFGEASALLDKERETRCMQAAALKQRLYDGLVRQESECVHFNGSMTYALPNILNISIADADSAVLLIALDMQGLAVSAGSACEAGAIEPSHVLQAMGTDAKWLHSSLRISVGKENTSEDMDEAIDRIRTVVHSVREKGES